MSQLCCCNHATVLFVALHVVISFSLLLSCTESGFKDTMTQTGPGMLTRMMCKHMIHIVDRINQRANGTNTSVNNSAAPQSPNDDNNYFDRVVVFDKSVFSPVPNSINVNLADTSEHSIAEREQIKKQYVTEDTVAIHWWQKSWYKGEK
jgi:hypothetical protein